MPKLTGTVTLVPAYGRDYNSAKEAREDFLKGKDFEVASVVHGSGYCSVRDFAPGSQAKIRFRKNQDSVIVDILDIPDRPTHKDRKVEK